MSIRFLLLIAALGLGLDLPASAASTLDKVRAQATLKCGVVGTPEDWTKADLHGPLAGLYAEICKAVSVTALGVKAKVDVTPYATEAEAQAGVAKGEVELVVGVTPDATALWQRKIAFGPTVFYDAQGFLVRPDVHAAGMAGLAGKRVCAVEGTDNDRILQAQGKLRHIGWVALDWQEEGEMDDALAVGRCDAVSAYLSHLAELKVNYAPISRDIILPDLLALAPAATAYRSDDAQWGRIVDWTIHALVQAEASGINQANVGQQAANEDPVVQRLIGTDWAASRALGLTAHDWAAQVIGVVGNYGEIYDRTVGERSLLKLPRGLNALWTNGGLMHPLAVK